jgi:hypothetical protein
MLRVDDSKQVNWIPAVRSTTEIQLLKMRKDLSYPSEPHNCVVLQIQSNFLYS